jgi:hypothetical protein
MNRCLLTFFLFFSLSVSAQTIRYVVPYILQGSDQSGRDWQHAAYDLQAMIDASSPGDQVWVENGTYKPTRDETGNPNPADPRTKTFRMKPGVIVYGGVEFNRYSLVGREINLNTNTCILSGDIGVAGNIADNCYHVVTSNTLSTSGISAPTGFNGFVIQDGNANNPTLLHGSIGGGVLFIVPGGGMQLCTFRNNQARLYGAGLAIYNVTLQVATLNCLFINNRTVETSSASGGAGAVCINSRRPYFYKCEFRHNAGTLGGGLLSVRSSVLVRETLFSSNTAIMGFGGAAASLEQSTPNFSNCVFIDNVSTGVGGAFYASDPVENISPSFHNCTFTRNTSYGATIFQENDNGIAEGFGVLELINCNVWGNTLLGPPSPSVSTFGGLFPSIQYSNVQSCSLSQHYLAGTGNLDTDPIFKPGTIALQPTSPLIDAGNPNSPLFLYFDTDHFGLPRYVRQIDMGASENQQTENVHSVQNGDWDAQTTWSCNCVPTRSDEVVLRHRVSAIGMGEYPFEARKLKYAKGGQAFVGSFAQLKLGVRVRYVKPTPTGSGDGSSWANASGNLQATLLAAQSGEEVWVQQGQYVVPSTSRSQSFTIKSGVKVYGGFVGTETSLVQRNINLATTTGSVLSGNINGQFTSNDNAYHVVYMENVALGTLLDGFTIESGSPAKGTGNPNDGVGGGIFNQSTGSMVSSPTIQNCVLRYNQGGTAGGAMYNGGTGRVTLRTCALSHNISDYGGAIACSVTPLSGERFDSNIDLRILNCTILQNGAYEDGTAIYGGRLTMVNSILYYNVRYNGPFGPLTIMATATGSQISYSTLQPDSPTALFLDATVSTLHPEVNSDTYRLVSGSPCIDAGDPTSQPSAIGAIDLLGNYRIVLGATNTAVRVDQGCVEYNSLSLGTY